jgi:hypothetical protein
VEAFIDGRWANLSSAVSREQALALIGAYRSWDDQRRVTFRYRIRPCSEED